VVMAGRTAKRRYNDDVDAATAYSYSPGDDSNNDDYYDDDDDDDYDFDNDDDGKTQEFYEFVMPPIDMFVLDDAVVILADMPGFGSTDIKVGLKLGGRVVRIVARKEKTDTDENLILAQRPRVIDKKIRLPDIYMVPDEVDKGKRRLQYPTATYQSGVLQIRVPMPTNNAAV